MANPENPMAKGERRSGWQLLLDNNFALLFIGVVVPTVFYIIWGIMEVLSVPVAE
jgi:hypothetical protein